VIIIQVQIMESMLLPCVSYPKHSLLSSLLCFESFFERSTQINLIIVLAHFICNDRCYKPINIKTLSSLISTYPVEYFHFSKLDIYSQYFRTTPFICNNFSSMCLNTWIPSQVIKSFIRE